MPTTKERLATLEEQNDAAKPHHEQTSKDIGQINQRLTAIETTLEILVTNGHQKPVALMDKAKATGYPLASGGGLIGLLWLALERFS